MDTSETYIKMCDCEEIQGQWKPKEGDYFSFVGDIHVLSDYEIWALEKKELSDVDCWNEVITLMGGHFVDHWNECREGFVWLPRQDQIQEMMQDTHELGGMLDCFNSFWNSNAWINEDDPGQPYPGVPEGHGIFHFFHTPEQLWLAFYMHEKHKKKWDGKKWVKK